MVELNWNIIIFLTLSMPNFSLPLVLRSFVIWLPWYVYGINRLPSSLIHITYLLLNDCMIPLPFTLISKSFGYASFVLLPPYKHTKLEPHARLCWSLDMELNIKGSGVRILFLNGYVSYAISHFGSIVHFITFPQLLILDVVPISFLLIIQFIYFSTTLPISEPESFPIFVSELDQSFYTVALYDLSSNLST